MTSRSYTLAQRQSYTWDNSVLQNFNPGQVGQNITFSQDIS